MVSRPVWDMLPAMATDPLDDLDGVVCEDTSKPGSKGTHGVDPGR